MKPTCELCVALPASLVSDVPHLREKSLKIGLIGRAASIFRVDHILLFPDLPDVDQTRDARLISVILSYMETPQYLRKRLFKIRPELRYAGILPPLRTPHHPLADRIADLRVGEYREGAVASSTKNGTLIDIGVERPVLVPDVKLKVKERVTVRIRRLGKHPRARLASREEIEEYWGYRVTISDVPFGELVKSTPFDLVVATSRYGPPFPEVEKALAIQWRMTDSRLVAFGSPAEGLHEIVAKEDLHLNEVVDFVLNTIPDQGTETVRTEEAIYTSLALLNVLGRS
ncbi:RNA-binding protein [Candidatus Bathyarchaeota archaeon]|nr:RNA-binding protein [Candidatus Bathyarchaeota archaeon]NIR14032.1 RNA-binding protein [Desulfobacterales bacterium]NIU80659.1 RNA-binding protein [Candidatus Bathyarchaeota archaeon]NIV67280.1 RNA-binding protein [Candidatus Bathyarchaeota archaeon]NIW15845.1 RNA-binding protein [Candidatus Bathyarchaeota archaeon]